MAASFPEVHEFGLVWPVAAVAAGRDVRGQLRLPRGFGYLPMHSSASHKDRDIQSSKCFGLKKSCHLLAAFFGFFDFTAWQTEHLIAHV